MSNFRYNQRGFIGILVVIVIGLGLLASPFLIYRAAKYHSIHTETLTITKKGDRTMQKNGDGSTNQYANLVYTNKGVYENVDATYPWKARSSDVYDQLQVGKTYTCEVAGWRIGFFSAYKNIIDCNGFKYQ